MTCLEPPPRPSLSALALAAIAASLPADISGVDGSWTLDMLPDCVAEIRADPYSEDAALVAAAETLTLDDTDLIAAALCLAIETSTDAAELIAEIQPGLPHARISLGLMAQATAAIGGTVAGLACGRAVASGLLVVDENDQPLPRRSLFMPLPMIAALHGKAADWENVHPLAPPTLVLPESFAHEAAARAKLLVSGEASGLVIRSPSRREAVAAAEMVAWHCRYGLAEIDGSPPPGLAAWLGLARRLPLFFPPATAGESWHLPRLGPYTGAWLVATSLEGDIVGQARQDEWTLPVPDVEERRQLWRHAGADDEDATRAAQTFRQGAGRIAEIGVTAGLAARRRGADRPEWTDFASGIASGSSSLDKLARRSHARVTDEALVLPDPLRDALDRLVARAQVRCRLAEGLGPAVRARYRPGVRALMTGESGTGKSLAAHWLAQQLGLPLYRVDMAALTSKWIGETEKNLSAILSAAEHADVLLFFDEADALFGGRTDVSNANDRYANAQTNYLLQRIEDFDGIVVLASNSRERFDPAFTRRLDAILTFPMPEPAARRDLWMAHLGSDHDLDGEMIDWLAVTVDLSGGHVRNIALAAAALARASGKRIGLADVRRALADEYEKLGRAMPQLTK